jgi:hypothetical protein
MEALPQLLAHNPNDGTSHYMLGNEYFKAQKSALGRADLAW